MGFVGVCGYSQFFNPYQQQQANQQAYEWDGNCASNNNSNKTLKTLVL